MNSGEIGEKKMEGKRTLNDFRIKKKKKFERNYPRHLSD